MTGVDSMLNLITGEAGTGKSYEMMNRIAGAVSSGRKVFAIVPDQFNFEYNRMLYNFMGLKKFNRMEVLSFSRLSKYIFIEHGGLKGRYADDTVRTVIMYRALSELNERKALHFYSRQALKTRFISDALEFVRTLSANGISSELLLRQTALMDDGIKEKAEDIALICSEYSRILEENGYKDSHTDISEASKRAAENGYFSDCDIFIDEFKSFTPDECEMLEVIIRDSNSVTVCLTTDKFSSDGFARMGLTPFETVDKTAARLSRLAFENSVKVNIDHLTENRRFLFPELQFLSKNVFRSQRSGFNGSCEAVRIYEAAEPYAEADFICAEINHLVREKGYRYSDIVITARQKENYSSILDAALERSEIPYYSDENGRVSHKSLIIFVRTALNLASVKNPSSEDFLRYIKTGFLPLDTEQIDILEEYCYKWNVEGGMWHKPFEIHDNSDSDRAAEAARLIVTEPLDNLRRKCTNTTAEAICRATADFLDEVKVPETISELIKGTNSGDAAVLTAVRETKQLWDMLCDLLQSFRRTLGDTPITAADFSSIFETAAALLTISAPPQTLDAVQLTSLNTARFANPKAVFILGANEGVFPFAANPSALLSDKDLAALGKSGVEINGNSPEKLAEERYAAYAALSAPTERLYISYPIASVSGNALYPSSAVRQIAAMFKNDIKLTEKKLGILYFCTTEQSAYYQYVQGFKRGSSEIASLKAALEDFNDGNSQRFKLLENPNSAKFRLNSGKALTDRLYGQVITLSASRFEDYKKCPFMYFCKKGLRIYPRQQTQLNAPSRGTAVHYCLCEFLKAYSKTSFIAMSREEITHFVTKKLSEYFISSDIGGSYGKTKRYLAAYRRLTDTVSDILIHLKTEFSQSLFTPSEFEYTFAFDGDEKPIKLTANDGTEMYFIGAVDRVDVYTQNDLTYIRVVDYKTGTKVFSLADIYYGINMQMLLYMFALTDPEAAANSGRYHTALPAGVLYVHAEDNAPSLSREASDDEITSAALFGEKMDGIVIADLDIVRAMEKDISGIFIPVNVKKDGEFSSRSKIISERALEKLRKYSSDLLRETASSIKQGKIEAAPLTDAKKNTSPCAYCDYQSICGYPNVIPRLRDPEAEKKMQESLGIIKDSAKESEQ
ncbi:MAG: exodeoxyribonuclease V subunit gamma [Oscillospiraceae bacterium]|nr:exodeoxyribonuclease V subunit gamma [Oscillospiraceae bacterium]